LKEFLVTLNSTKRVVAILMLALTLMGTFFVQTSQAKVIRDNEISVLIGFKGSIDTGIITRVGGVVTYEFPRIRGVAAKLPRAAISALNGDPSIEFVELDRIVYALGQTLPWGIKRVNATAVWDTDGDMDVDLGAIAGSGIKVAVIDTGIDYTHPDLVDRYGGGYDFVNNDPDPMDDNGHGTHVSGTIAATDNDIGVIGVAPEATIYALKALNATGQGSTSDVIRSILWAVDHGMNIISMSLGSAIPSLLEMRACNLAYESGVLLVAATGNDGHWYAGFPAGYASVIGVGAIAEDNTLASFSNKGLGLDLVAPGVDVNSTVPVGTGPVAKVIVDSTELSANMMEYSPETPETGITAQILYASLGYPENFTGQDFTGKLALIQRGEISFAEKVANAYAAGAMGAIIYNNQPGNFEGTLGSPGAIPAVSLSQDDGLYMKGLIEAGSTTTTLIAYYGSDYAVFSGTSMATPHVSGVAALVLAANPSLTPAEVRAILESAAVDLGSPGKDPTYGYGLVDAYAAVQKALTP
jgi:serine protease